MSNRRMAEAYDRIAGIFAERNAATSAHLLGLGERFLALAGPTPRVLDLGCGPGRDTDWLADRGARLVGVDLSRGMLAEARARTRASLARMDMRRLGFTAGCFDAVWCMASLLHLAKAEAPHALQEIRRALRPGGVLHLGLQAGGGEGWEVTAYGPVERFFARYSPDEAGQLLRQAGFFIRHAEVYEGNSRTWLHLLATTPAA